MRSGSPSGRGQSSTCTGLARQELEGTGWAVGAMLQPAAGGSLLGGPVSRITDSFVDLDRLPGLDGPVVAHVRAAIGGRPDDPAYRRAAVAVVERALASLLPVDEEGLLVNAVVEHVESRAAASCSRRR